ncbi:hypothetical protein DSO57_1014901 [Entomophthora muscae]|nr:hypothetical protein DSO57_1014901 [Entomophthora muscae]
MCVFSGMLRVAGRQMYCFLNIAIAVNLQLIFINGLRPSAKWEMFYWGIPVFLVTVMNSPPLFLGMFGHDGSRCFLKSSNKQQERILLGINFSCVMIVTFLYCCGVTLVVGFRLRSKLRIVQNLAPHRFQRDIEAASVEKSLKKLLFRITLYPLTFIISMFFYFVVTIMYILDTSDTTTFALAKLGLSLTGMLGFGAFLMDPTLHVASKSMLAKFLPPEKQLYSPEKSLISDSSSTIELSRIPLTYRQFDNASSEPRVGGNNNLRLL